MQSYAERQDHEEGFAELGTIVHDGKEFTNLGASVDDQYAYVYVKDNGTVTDWHGNRLGTYRTLSTWRAIAPIGYAAYYTMQAIRVRLEDGREYSGRYSCNWSELCKCKRVKS